LESLCWRVLFGKSGYFTAARVPTARLAIGRLGSAASRSGFCLGGDATRWLRVFGLDPGEGLHRALAVAAIERGLVIRFARRAAVDGCFGEARVSVFQLCGWFRPVTGEPALWRGATLGVHIPELRPGARVRLASVQTKYSTVSRRAVGGWGGGQVCSYAGGVGWDVWGW